MSHSAPARTRYELLQAAEAAHAEDLTLRFHPVAWEEGFSAGLDAQSPRITALEEALGAMLRRGDGQPSACRCAACNQARALLNQEQTAP